MVKGEGAQKQRTHTPRPENAHIDTLWEQGEGGAGTVKVWASVINSLQQFTAEYDQVAWRKERCAEVKVLFVDGFVVPSVCI